MPCFQKHINMKNMNFYFQEKMMFSTLPQTLPGAMNMVEAVLIRCVWSPAGRNLLLASPIPSHHRVLAKETYSNCLICYMFLEVGCGGKEAMPRYLAFEIISNINNYPSISLTWGSNKIPLVKSCQCSLACKQEGPFGFT